MAIRAGLDILMCALLAQESGQIEGFEIFCDEDDPSIITEIVVRKAQPVH